MEVTELFPRGRRRDGVGFDGERRGRAWSALKMHLSFVFCKYFLCLFIPFSLPFPLLCFSLMGGAHYDDRVPCITEDCQAGMRVQKRCKITPLAVGRAAVITLRAVSM